MTTTAVAIKDDMTLSELGQVLVKSGFFADSRDASQAIVKVLAGRELGFGPIASMTGFYIVKGRVSMSANLMAAAVKRSGRYDFRVRKLDNVEAAIEFLEHIGSEWVSLGVSSFTVEDAKRAGTQNLEKFPRNMLYARAMSNGVKWFCADVTGGPIYTPDELGEVVDVELQGRERFVNLGTEITAKIVFRNQVRRHPRRTPFACRSLRHFATTLRKNRANFRIPQSIQ